MLVYIPAYSKSPLSYSIYSQLVVVSMINELNETTFYFASELSLP